MYQGHWFDNRICNGCCINDRRPAGGGEGICPSPQLQPSMRSSSSVVTKILLLRLQCTISPSIVWWQLVTHPRRSLSHTHYYPITRRAVFGIPPTVATKAVSKYINTSSVSRPTKRRFRLRTTLGR